MTGTPIPDESIDLQIRDVLQTVSWPTSKDALVDIACEAGASNDVLSMLKGLPEQDYTDVASVTRLIGSNFGPGLGA